MERLNCVNRQFSKENSVTRNRCANGNNRIVQEICSDSCCKISYSHDLSSDNSNKSLVPEEYVPSYECDKPSGYVFVDVGSNLIESVNLLEEDDDSCKVNSETVFTDSKDIDCNLIKNVSIERLLKNCSKENEMQNHNLETTVFNISDICTGIDRSGFSTNACVANICENVDSYDKKPSIAMDYTTTSTVVNVSEGFEKENKYVKEEQGIEDVHRSTKNMNFEIKKEEMDYNEEVSVLNESIIDFKLHPVDKSLDVNTNYSYALGKNSKSGFFVLSESINSDFQEVHTECSEEVPDNSDIGDVMVLKSLEENETVQSKRQSFLKLQNKVQTMNRTGSEFQIKPETNSGGDTGAAGVEEYNKLNKDDVNRRGKNKNVAVCQHRRETKSKNTIERKYVCNVCNKNFTHLCDLKGHKCTHTGDRPFGCDTCGKTFTHKCSLKDHIRIHTGDRPFCCDICGKRFTHKRTLDNHKLTHTGETPFACDTCGKTFTQKCSLKDHVRIHTGDRPFGCDTCGKTFTQLAHLKCHKLTHTGETPFGCDTCGKTFTRKGSLKDHIRIHTGERHFGCDTCGKTFRYNSSLKVHICVHTGDRRFGCDTCGKRFTHTGTLHNHKRVHIGDRPFGCDTCGTTFTHKRSLHNHKRVHTCDRPFGCDTCGRTFTHKHNLHKHKRNLHEHKRIHTVDKSFGYSV